MRGVEADFQWFPYITGKAKLRSPGQVLVLGSPPSGPSACLPWRYLSNNHRNTLIWSGAPKETAGLVRKVVGIWKGISIKCPFRTLKDSQAEHSQVIEKRWRKLEHLLPSKCSLVFVLERLPFEIYDFLRSGFTYSILFDRDVCQRLFFFHGQYVCDSMPDWGENIVP